MKLTLPKVTIGMDSTITGIQFICGPGEQNLTIGNFVEKKASNIFCKLGFSHAQVTKVKTRKILYLLPF
jgi:hypothetical protein